MTNLFPGLADLASSGYVFRIVDNGGESADRYTFVTCDGDYIAMSGSPTHPCGVSQSGECSDLQWISDGVEDGSLVDLAIGDLPENVALHALGRINEGWRDFLESALKAEGATPEFLKCGEGYVVAPSRDEAEVNEGTYTCAGVGLYRDSAGKFWVRIDNPGPEDDRGPYDTAREALVASLPEDSSLSGPEYHSTADVARLTADPVVAGMVKALERVRVNENDAEPRRADALVVGDRVDMAGDTYADPEPAEGASISGGLLPKLGYKS
jgi:hypothetical protein